MPAIALKKDNKSEIAVIKKIKDYSKLCCVGRKITANRVCK
jgi:hypothetical protein